jgi:hypothetical protein
VTRLAKRTLREHKNLGWCHREHQGLPTAVVVQAVIPHLILPATIPFRGPNGPAPQRRSGVRDCEGVLRSGETRAQTGDARLDGNDFRHTALLHLRQRNTEQWHRIGNLTEPRPGASGAASIACARPASSRAPEFALLRVAIHFAQRAHHPRETGDRSAGERDQRATR